MDEFIDQTIEYHPELYSIPGIPYKEKIIPLEKKLMENTEYTMGASIKEDHKMSHSLRIICGILNNQTEIIGSISINQIKINRLVQEKLDKIIDSIENIGKIQRDISGIKSNIEVLDELDKLQGLDDILITVKHLTETINKLTEKL